MYKINNIFSYNVDKNATIFALPNDTTLSSKKITKECPPTSIRSITHFLPNCDFFAIKKQFLTEKSIALLEISLEKTAREHKY